MNPCIEYVIKCTGSLNINKKVGENHNILKLVVNDTEIHPIRDDHQWTITMLDDGSVGNTLGCSTWLYLRLS